MKQKEFRKELIKTMPGYKWTIHRDGVSGYLSATGILSKGFNRMSTLSVVRTESDRGVEYGAKSSGFGGSAPWVATRTGGTLRGALRALQDHYESLAVTYRNAESALRYARLDIKTYYYSKRRGNGTSKRSRNV